MRRRSDLYEHLIYRLFLTLGDSPAGSHPAISDMPPPSYDASTPLLLLALMLWWLSINRTYKTKSELLELESCNTYRMPYGKSNESKSQAS